MEIKELRDNLASCLLCPHHCQLRPEQVGKCRTRINREGEITSLTYGEMAAWHTDPIEKKPLYHFYPGSWIFSVAGYGCNLSCTFCQNYEISQTRRQGQRISPKELAEMAKESLGLCITYSEPTMWFEMIRDTAPLVKKEGGKVVLISNGIIEPRFLNDLVPYIDAMNIDIKGFSEEFYQKYCGAKLSWVLNTIERVINKTHLEVTTLIIPGANDNIEEIINLRDWLFDLGVPVPWHLSRYFPAYKLSLPPTEKATLLNLWNIAREKLPYVYLGNLEGGSTTYCPACKEGVIFRENHILNRTINGTCPNCGEGIFGEGL